MSIEEMEEILETMPMFSTKVRQALTWVKEGELAYINVWGADSKTGEGSQIRLWYNHLQETYYSRMSTGMILKCKSFRMVYQHLVKKHFDEYDEQGIKLYKTDKLANGLYKHLYKGDLK